MATGQQVALTRTHRLPSTSSHISKAARQVVPAFLQKLYEMVNDENNAELIRWSETGDSFFVLDHERFAHEVLGRWFKHRNFSSFVRQLNMYGFHKIPHLQQGVLKSDTDTEFWNFAHANFQRAQPDLLCLIQRKKQAPQQDDPPLELPNATNGAGLIGAPNATVGSTAGATATLSNGQVLDIHTIVSGINVIKRHQTTISAELNDLKRSNQLLWQDALATRTRHQKQQDTINRIVKFLAGVFGSHPAAAGANMGVPSETPTVGSGQEDQDGVDEATVGPRRRMRLMIEDARRDGPISIPSPTLAVDNSNSNGEVPNGDSIFSPPPASTTENGDSIVSPLPASTTEEQQVSRAVSPNRSPTTIEFDPRIHHMVNALSPSQLQLLLTMLAGQNITDAPPAPAETINPSATSSLTQYQPQFGFSQANPSFNQLPIDSLISFDNYYPQLPEDNTQSVVPSGQHDYEQRLDNNQRATEDIDDDVSAMDTSINTLIQTLGLDPVFEGVDQNQSEMNGTASEVNPLQAETTAPEFDIDSLLNHLSNGSSGPGPGLGMDYNMGVSCMGDLTSAFLDEVQTPTTSPDMTTSPAQPLRQVSPEVTMNGTSDADSSSIANLLGLNPGVDTSGRGASGRKRKSETVADMDPAMAMLDTARGGPGTNVKRRKDK